MSYPQTNERRICYADFEARRRRGKGRGEFYTLNVLNFYTIQRSLSAAMVFCFSKAPSWKAGSAPGRNRTYIFPLREGRPIRRTAGAVSTFQLGVFISNTKKPME